MRAVLDTNILVSALIVQLSHPAAIYRAWQDGFFTHLMAEGRLVLHNGHVLHQMAGVPRLAVTDERITLQGHGVFADAAWRLYW